MQRLQDGLLGLCFGYYVLPTVILFGVSVHWALVGLIISYTLPSLRKLGQFLWKKLLEKIAKDLKELQN